MNSDAPKRLAQLVLARSGVSTLPVPVAQIAKAYAEVRQLEIPFGFDGLTIKRKGRKPEIIVNRSVIPARRRFTLAHELGHVLMPWHNGIIVDNIDPEVNGHSPDYSQLEAEANSFASELLLPESIVGPILTKGLDSGRNLPELCKEISDKSGTSYLATFFRIFQIFDRNLAFIVTDLSGTVLYVGKTEDIILVLPRKGEIFQPELYGDRLDIVDRDEGGRIHYFVKPKVAVGLRRSHNTDWREPFEAILRDSFSDKDELYSGRQSVNGIWGALKSMRRTQATNFNDYYNAANQRILGRPKLKWLFSHPKYPEFLRAKINDLLDKD